MDSLCSDSRYLARVLLEQCMAGGHQAMLDAVDPVSGRERLSSCQAGSETGDDSCDGIGDTGENGGAFDAGGDMVGRTSIDSVERSAHGDYGNGTVKMTLKSLQVRVTYPLPRASPTRSTHITCSCSAWCLLHQFHQLHQPLDILIMFHPIQALILAQLPIIYIYTRYSPNSRISGMVRCETECEGVMMMMRVAVASPYIASKRRCCLAPVYRGRRHRI